MSTTKVPKLTAKQLTASNAIVTARSAAKQAVLEYKKLLANCKHKYIQKGTHAFCLVCKEMSATPYCSQSPTKVCNYLPNTYTWREPYCDYCSETFDDRIESIEEEFEHE